MNATNYATPTPQASKYGFVDTETGLLLLETGDYLLLETGDNLLLEAVAHNATNYSLPA
jgi:hypothetical protein